MDKSIEIYNLFIIVLFGTIISSVIINSIKNRFKKKVSNQVRLIWIVVLSFLISFFTYKIMNIISKKNEMYLVIKNEKARAEADSLKKIFLKEKTALSEKERRNSIVNAVQKYFNVTESKDVYKYDSLFTFPVKKYFVITNVSKERVNERIRFAWHSSPSLSFTVTNENTHIDDYIDSVIVLVNLNIENKVKNVIAKIKYDQNLKIYSLNNFYQTQQQTQKILSPKDTIK